MSPTTDQVVAICTRNRPDDLATALDHVRAIDADIEILVADASDPEVRDRVAAVAAGTEGVTLLDCRPGLARQRNQALAWIRAQRPDTDVVHFIDDDTEVGAGYFAEITSTFAGDPDLAGVGGVVLNQDRPRHVRIKSLFCLYSTRPGIVLPSGRTTIGHYEGDEASAPQWLPGCAMSYRLPLLGDAAFDDRLEGYSYGEDMYFSYAVRARHRLAIAPKAQVVHRLSPQNRLSRTRLARDKVALLHRFVRENRDRGMRVSAFWWSVAGDVALKLLDGIAHADRDSVAESGAMLRAAGHTLVRPLPARGTGG
ncbi:MAG: glycosyltransferase [Nocardioides sp.]